jgi:hypothetical protein
MMLLGTIVTDPFFGILNLDPWDLFEIWYLVLGIFIIFQLASNFRKTLDYLSK